MSSYQPGDLVYLLEPHLFLPGVFNRAESLCEVLERTSDDPESYTVKIIASNKPGYQRGDVYHNAPSIRLMSATDKKEARR